MTVRSGGAASLPSPAPWGAACARRRWRGGWVPSRSRRPPLPPRTRGVWRVPPREDSGRPRLVVTEGPGAEGAGGAARALCAPLSDVPATATTSTLPCGHPTRTRGPHPAGREHTDEGTRGSGWDREGAGLGCGQRHLVEVLPDRRESLSPFHRPRGKAEPRVTRKRRHWASAQGPGVEGRPPARGSQDTAGCQPPRPHPPAFLGGMGPSVPCQRPQVQQGTRAHPPEVRELKFIYKETVCRAVLSMGPLLTRDSAEPRGRW